MRYSGSCGLYRKYWEVPKNSLRIRPPANNLSLPKGKHNQAEAKPNFEPPALPPLDQSLSRGVVALEIAISSFYVLYCFQVRIPNRNKPFCHIISSQKCQGEAETRK